MRVTEMNYDEYLERAKMYRNERLAVIDTLKELGCADIKIDGLDSSNVVPMGTCL